MIEQLKQTGEGEIVIGTVTGGIRNLFPQIDQTTIPDFIQAVTFELEKSCRCVYVINSAAQRLIGGTPRGWKTPNYIWRDLITDYPELENSPVAQRLAFGGNNDLDIRFDPKTPKSDLESLLYKQSSRHKLPISVEKLPVPHHDVFRIAFSDIGFHLDIGEANFFDTGYQDDCRLSAILPVRLAFNWVDIKGSKLVVRDDAENMLRNEIGAMNTFKDSPLATAVVAAQRYLLADYWWPSNGPCDKRSYRYPDMIREVNYWQRSRKSIGKLDLRQEEIVAGFALLLTCDPVRFWQELQDCHLLFQTQLAKRFDLNIQLNIDQIEYERKFHNRMLSASESGVATIAHSFGISPDQFLSLLTISV